MWCRVGCGGNMHGIALRVNSKSRKGCEKGGQRADSEERSMCYDRKKRQKMIGRYRGKEKRKKQQH